MDSDIDMREAESVSVDADSTAIITIGTEGLATCEKTAGRKPVRKRPDTRSSENKGLRRLVRNHSVSHSRFRTITSSAGPPQPRRCNDEYGEAVWQEMRLTVVDERTTIDPGAPLYQAEDYWTEMQNEADTHTAENEYYYETSSDEEAEDVYEQLARSSARAHDAQEEAEARRQSIRAALGLQTTSHYRRAARAILASDSVQQQIAAMRDHFERHILLPTRDEFERYLTPLPTQNTWLGTVDEILARLERKDISDLTIEEWDLMKEQYEEGKCSICYDPLETPCLTPCFHVFCAECLVRWAKEHGTCPLCRDKFAGEGDIWGLVDGKKDGKEEAEE